MRVLSPRLPPHTRAGLAVRRRVDIIGCWLVEHGHTDAAERLWRAVPDVAVSMGGLLLVILWLNAALGLAWLLSGPYVVRRNGGLVDMGLPKPKGSTGRWDDPPADLDD